MDRPAIPAPERRLSTRLAAALLAAILLVAAAPLARAFERLLSVVVMGPSAPAAAEAVAREGGAVDAHLPIIDGVLAHVPESEIADLSRLAFVVPDRPIRLQHATFDADDAAQHLVTAYPREVGAPRMWYHGRTGRGVTVGLVDTGVADVPDLRGRVVFSADISGELLPGDTYGHGTFMAGLVAGNGAASGGRYAGVAPEASLASVKVAGADGTTTLGKVLKGVQIIDVVRSTHNVKVLLLAVDSGSPLPPELDPLSLALRRLWGHGVLVVVPAGNEGGEPGTIAAPGEDPVLLTAGSVDDLGTGEVLDDLPSAFSGRGPTRWGDEKPDLAAPGEHLVSLRAPGSTVDRENPTSVVERAYFRASGTSMSAAVTAGAAALFLSARSLVPDETKAVLMGTARPIPAGEADTVGAGIVNAADASALGEKPQDLSDIPELFTLEETVDFGWMTDREASPVWAARQWAARQWSARQWSARQWAARQWSARQWSARQWAGAEWAARQWSARQWSFDAWAARQWSSSEWTARQWSFEYWAARQWAARQWSADEWDARQWSARQWSARQWSARQWSALSWT